MPALIEKERRPAREPMSSSPMHENQQIPVILICGNFLVRAGIRQILNATRFTVAGELEDSSNMPAFSDPSPALFIIDESRSADALAGIVTDVKAHCLSARVVALADHLDPKTIMQALQAGMNGLCSTGMERDALIRALELVMLGETFIPATVALTMLNEVPQTHESRTSMATAPTPANDTATRTYNLSSREAEILRRLMEGESNKVIARKLDVAEATIKVHVKSILRKIQAKNRTQAAIWATAHLSTTSSSRPMTQGEK